MAEKPKVKITENGPYLISGNLPLITEIAITEDCKNPKFWKKGKIYPKKENYALCRCGYSKNHPFCDGTHTKMRFNGTETAPKTGILNDAEKTTGPTLDLIDAKKLCSGARFCHINGNTWDNVEMSNKTNARKIAIETACNCPAGRLIVIDKKTQKPIEIKFDPTISLIEDPDADCSGPIWLKGGIELESSDGTKYEKRNRVTICRCGKSTNKPFCDSSHVRYGFNAINESKNK